MEPAQPFPHCDGLLTTHKEEFSGTSWEMIRRVYDEVTVEDMREAMGLETRSNCEQQLRALG